MRSSTPHSSTPSPTTRSGNACSRRCTSHPLRTTRSLGVEPTGTTFPARVARTRRDTLHRQPAPTSTKETTRSALARILLGDPAVMISTQTRDIPGIYNYCDRWCERCAFTARCRLYKDVDERGGHGPEMSMDATIEFVKATVEETRRQIEAEASARGIPMPTEAELAEISREEAAERKELARHPLVALADRYITLVHEWGPTERDLLRGKADGLLARCEKMEEPERLENEARRVLDALAVIQWHVRQIAVKLRRAMSSRREGRWGRSDANGSTKVALIGIDRSLAAWRVLQEWCPETTTHQVIIDTLAELKSAAEREFPRARAFRRPGFDSY